MYVSFATSASFEPEGGRLTDDALLLNLLTARCQEEEVYRFHPDSYL